jgi:hypothetical protein
MSVPCLLSTLLDVLLQCYVELHGRALSVAVRRSVGSTNWLHAAEPRAPRPVCDLLLERINKAEAEVSRLVEATGRSGGRCPMLSSILCCSAINTKQKVLLESLATIQGLLINMF